MTLRFTNTYTRRLEEFVPLQPGRVHMYHCGPTVYDHLHIGNFRSFLFSDLLRRVLEYNGFAVRQVMNITDVGHLRNEETETGEDRMEIAARREKLDPYAIAEKYTDEFMRTLRTLNVRMAHEYPRATRHTKEMLAQIQTLIEKGHAYEVNGNVYFEVKSFSDYGKLSGNSIEQLEAGKRIEINPEKRHPADFALWKQDPKHAMQFDSPWGKGFPGWHIECSAMGMKYLGETFDIHTGGEDNIFPHHECEIAQAVCATGKPFVRTWLHVRHLLLKGKMSKSKGGTVTVDELIGEGYDAATIRYVLTSVHYRQQYPFTREGLDAARAAVQRLVDFRRRLRDAAGEGELVDSARELVENADRAFRVALDDDLNISGALGRIFEFVTEANRYLDQKREPAAAARFLSALEGWDEVLGVLALVREEAPDAEIQALIDRRTEARSRKDFEEADRIRRELESRGIILEDSKEGTKWKRAR